jgi:LacI family transcriptional regulator
VSFVLRGDPRFSPTTVARVKAAAEELGYDPSQHHAARRLVMMRRGVRVINHLVGLFLPAHFYQANYFAQLFQGVAESLTRARYGMLMLPMYGWQESPEEFPFLPPSLTRGEVDGLIAFCATASAETLLGLLGRYYDLDTFPIVLLIHDVPGCSAVVADDEAGGHAAVAHLLALGHRHLLTVPEMTGKTETYLRRRQGMERALHEAGLDPARYLHELPEVLGSSFPPHHLDIDAIDVASHPLIGYLSAHPEITGILARNDAAARRIHWLLSQTGRRVPDDYSLIGYDDVDPLLDANGRNILTSVRVPLDALGQAAAELLIRQVQTESVTPERLVLPVELQVRGTTAPR